LREVGVKVGLKKKKRAYIIEPALWRPQRVGVSIFEERLSSRNVKLA